MIHAYVCDKCDVIFWAEPNDENVVHHECGEQCDRLVRPSVTSDIGGAVRIAKDKYIDL